MEADLAECSGREAVAYAVSDNGQSIFDLEETVRVLGYQPKDDAESFRWGAGQ